MARYTSIPVAVDAQQYRTGANIPGVLVDNDGAFVFVGGEPVPVSDGDWIVVHEDDSREVVPAGEFPLRFAPAREAA